MRRFSIFAVISLLLGLLASAVGAAPAWASNNGDSVTFMSACNLTSNNCALDPVTTHYGQAVDFLISVDDDSGSCGPARIDCDHPQGTVEVHDGDPNTTPALTSTALTPDDILSYRSTAEPQFAGLAPGHHETTARYVSIPGDNGFNPSVSAPEAVDVSKEGTSTSLSQSSTSNVVGQGPDLTATVTANDAPDTAHGALKPGGQVQFLDGSNLLGTSNVDSSTGQATWHAGTLGAGPHSLTASYLGDTNYSASASAPAISHSVSQGGTTTVANITPTSAVAGQPVSWSNTVTPVAPASGSPTGTVTFTDNGNFFGTSPANGGIGSSPLPVGPHSFVATYPGDDNFTGSTSNPVSVTVTKANTTTALTGPSSSTGGQAATFTATVSVVAPGAGTRTGTVQFKDGAANLGTPKSVDSSGVAALTTSVLAPGSHQITAVYSGDANFNGSTSSTVTDTVTCDKVVTGSATSVDGVSGTTCVASATVGGNIKVPAGGKLLLLTDTVGGTVNVTGAGQVIICGSTFGGNVKINGDNGFLLLGDPADDSCAGNTFNSGVTLGSNTAGLALVGNKIGGGVSITGNSGSGPAPNHTSPKVGGNTISGNLACSGDSPVMTDGGLPNSVSGNRSGECGAAGF